MTNLTLGQRIAEQRKKLGLSQEALGEKMNVSRQAISKWEADGAMPEVDKLISLSRLFDISLGQLLGVEQPAAEKTAGEGVSEEQLRAIEEIVKKYQPAKPRKLPVLLTWAAIAVMAAGLMLAQWEILRLRNRVSEIGGIAQQAEYESRVNANALDALEAAQQKQTQPALLADYSFEVTPQADAPAVTVSFTAVPAVWQAGNEGYLSIRLGEQEQYLKCSQNSAFMTVSAELEVADGYELCFTMVHADGTREHQVLHDDDVENLESAMFVTVKTSHGRQGYKDGVFSLTGYEFSVSMPDLGWEYGIQQWNSIDLVLRCGGEEIGRMNLLRAIEEKVDEVTYSPSITFCQERIEFQGLILEAGEGLELWLDTELASGLTSHTLIDSWATDSWQTG